MTSKQIKQKRTRSSELDETLFEVCGSQDIDQDLTTLETDIKRLQGKKGKFVCFIIRITPLFYQVGQGDSERIFRSSSQAATCLPHTEEASHCPFNC